MPDVQGLNSVDPGSGREWAKPAAGLRLGEGEVHVWRCSRPDCRNDRQHLAELLSEEERERTRRFRRAEDRELFVISHGALRVILGGYLSANPGDLSFAVNEHGKPVLAERRREGGVTFNLSHSRDLALVAVARNREIGVDVEYMRDPKNPGQLAKRFFAEEEKLFLASHPPEEMKSAFFRCWTRKEAYVKGLGRGIGYSLSSFSVIAKDGKPATMVRDAKAPAGGPAWSLFCLSPGPEYLGAVAVEDFTGVPALFTYVPGPPAGDGPHPQDRR